METTWLTVVALLGLVTALAFWLKTRSARPATGPNPPATAGAENIEPPPEVAQTPPLVVESTQELDIQDLAKPDSPPPAPLVSQVAPGTRRRSIKPPDPQDDFTRKSYRSGLSRLRDFWKQSLSESGPDESHDLSGWLSMLERVLIKADVGVEMTDQIISRLRQTQPQAKSFHELMQALRSELKILLETPGPSETSSEKPHVIVVVGVNGAGKTTTIGKLAYAMSQNNRRVVLVAADTFRAAAVEQIEGWGRRSGVSVVKGEPNADPASVVFDAIQRAKSEGFDTVIVDTAGRLHTHAPLMDELKKLQRSASKALGGRNPNEVLLVIDGTTGQNAWQQGQAFVDAVGVTGLVATKLDGTSKGGALVGLVQRWKLPIRWIGLGERMDDLRPFDPELFVKDWLDVEV